MGETCSTIWAVLRLPCRPMRPVRQNWQFCAQPTCEEMHSVVRCGRLERGLRTGMITASTVPAAPSPCTRHIPLADGFILGYVVGVPASEVVLLQRSIMPLHLHLHEVQSAPGQRHSVLSLLSGMSHSI